MMDTAAAHELADRVLRRVVSPKELADCIDTIADEVDRLQAIEKALDSFLEVFDHPRLYDAEDLASARHDLYEALLYPASRSVTPGGPPGKETAGSDA